MSDLATAGVFLAILVIIGVVVYLFAPARCPKCGEVLIDNGDVSILGEYFDKWECLNCGYEE